MANPIKEATVATPNKSVESVVKITRKEFEDGGYEEKRVEQVEGGFIITISTHKKVNGEWTWEDKKSVSTEDPDLDTSSKGLAERLEKLFNS